jgi:predicted secreted protein
MRFHPVFFVIMILAAALFAGDSAQFCSIGWSPDYNFYSFAQYGEQDGSGFPYADLFVVDVAQNTFVENGVERLLWKDDIDTAAEGLHVLLSLYVKADSVLNARGISVSRQVRPIFLNTGNECVTAQWRMGEKSFSIDMKQEAKGDPGSFESEAAFHLELLMDNAETMTIGNKDRFRKNVLRYDIDRVFQPPENNSMVILIRMTKLGFEGPDTRYMVETIKLN